MTAGLLFSILLLALGLRFYRLDAQSLWNDEGTSVAVSQRSLATVTRDAASDIHPPLYYWLLGGWVRLFGVSEAAVRSLSALLGVVLVALTYKVGKLVAGYWAGLVAAALSAIHPFQIAYSQEARMYMLAAVLAAASVLAVMYLTKESRRFTWMALSLLEAAGLYAHYSFLFVVVALNLAYLLGFLWWKNRSNQPAQQPMQRSAVRWILSQLGVLLLYLPWLPTAIRQITSWPRPDVTTELPAAVLRAWSWLVFGPSLPSTAGTIPLATALTVAIFGLIYLAWRWDGDGTVHNRWSAGMVALWLALPVLLMLVLGLYREAYLKFLLVSTPALACLLACGLLAPGLTRQTTEDQAPSQRSNVTGSNRPRAVTIPPHRLSAPRKLRIHGPRLALYALRFLQLLAVLIIVATSVISLRNYYADPAYARDNYRGISAYVEASGRPGDSVVLNAPGQLEVFEYYYGGNLPVYPLPADRPLDAARTEASLAELARPGGRVYAILWATDESDPGHFIEGWLDSHAYKALDSWYGNVRLVVYAVPEHSPSAPGRLLHTVLRSGETGDQVTLVGFSLLSDRVAAGDIAQISLYWVVDQTPQNRYKVFLHVLDEANHIVGQRDAEPGGGAHLTTLWTPGELIVDNYGVPIHPATPPGRYRVEVGAYDALTGRRLLLPDGSDQIWLDPLDVGRPSTPAPSATLNMRHSLSTALGELALLGYDAHKLGFGHQPDEPLGAGDTLALALYWEASQQPSGRWQLAIYLVAPDGRQRAEVSAEPVPGYPTEEWRIGDVWRGQFNLPIPADAPPGRYRLRLCALAPDGTESVIDLPETLGVGP